MTLTGWYADYGYCIDITHKDGSVTRYGHLDAIGVVKGQAVPDNLKSGVLLPPYCAPITLLPAKRWILFTLSPITAERRCPT